jgi:hypothetical protein
LNKAQRKYPVYDQELLAIAATLNEYRIYIEGCASFIVITDHRPMVHIPTQPKIGRRHVRWVSVLSQYRKRSDNDSDALSKREDLEDLTEEIILDNPILEKKFDEYDAGSFERDLEGQLGPLPPPEIPTNMTIQTPYGTLDEFFIYSWEDRVEKSRYFDFGDYFLSAREIENYLGTNVGIIPCFLG